MLLGLVFHKARVLGPLFFLIYINDLAMCFNFDVTLYMHANDSVLALTHKNVLSLQNNINQENYYIKLKNGFASISYQYI